MRALASPPGDTPPTHAVVAAERRLLHAAMQSVYMHSVGAALVSEAAPAVMLPGFDVMKLSEAMRILATSPARLRVALWTIARSIPPAPLRYAAHEPGGTGRYPPAVLDVLTDSELVSLADFELLRASYCREAGLFATAIVAFAHLHDCWERFDLVHRDYFHGSSAAVDRALRKLVPPPSGGPDGAFTVTRFLEQSLDREGAAEHCARELRRFEREVQMTLPDFLAQFADAVAFEECFPPAGSAGPARVFPAIASTVQSTATLVADVTVTVVVAGQSFEAMRISMDPQSWSACSDAFEMVRYVKGPLDLRPLEPQPVLGAPVYAPLMLEEKVLFLWGRGDDETGWCQNVIRIDRIGVDERAQTIDVSYGLARSVASRVLWDVRPGGLLVDDGYSVCRPVVAGRDDLWRVTASKSELWSNRAPYATGAGKSIGNALNYLAPAIVAWWLESEAYTHDCRATTTPILRSLGEP